MLKLSSSRRIKIDVPVLSVSWSVVDHSVIIQALKKGLIEQEASNTGGVPRWKSSCPDRLAEATECFLYRMPFLLLKSLEIKRNILFYVYSCIRYSRAILQLSLIHI